jgi:hypothetical protein
MRNDLFDRFLSRFFLIRISVRTKQASFYYVVFLLNFSLQTSFWSDATKSASQDLSSTGTS